MHLYWSDQDSIAQALCRAYPDEDRLALSLTALHQKICTLPDFADQADPPSKNHLEKILWLWMQAAHADDMERC